MTITQRCLKSCLNRRLNTLGIIMLFLVFPSRPASRLAPTSQTEKVKRAVQAAEKGSAIMDELDETPGSSAQSPGPAVTETSRKGSAVFALPKGAEVRQSDEDVFLAKVQKVMARERPRIRSAGGNLFFEYFEDKAWREAGIENRLQTFPFIGTLDTSLLDIPFFPSGLKISHLGPKNH